MEVRIVDERRMPEPLDRQIRDGLCACFPNDRKVFSVTRAWHGSAPTFSAVIQDRGLVVAHVGVHERTIAVGEGAAAASLEADSGGAEATGQIAATRRAAGAATGALRVGGVQNVFVRPEYRGQKLVDRVMEASMTEAGARQMDAGLLFCLERLVPTYARTGWRVLEGRRFQRIDGSGRAVPLPAMSIAMWLPLKSDEFPAGDVDLCGNDW